MHGGHSHASQQRSRSPWASAVSDVVSHVQTALHVHAAPPLGGITNACSTPPQLPAITMNKTVVTSAHRIHEAYTGTSIGAASSRGSELELAAMAVLDVPGNASASLPGSCEGGALRGLGCWHTLGE